MSSRVNIVLACGLLLGATCGQVEAQVARRYTVRPVARGASAAPAAETPAKAAPPSAPARRAVKPAPAPAAPAAVQIAAPRLALAGVPTRAEMVAPRLALAVPAAAATTAAVTEDSVPSAAEPAKAAPAVMEVGIGTVKFSGLLQAWYSAGSGEDVSTFRLRRAEIKFAGEIAPRAQWTVSVDPSKALKINNSYAQVGDARVVTDGKVSQGSTLLQDAHMTLKFGSVELDAGQFKLPLTREGALQSSGKLETVERALFISGGKYGLVRDLGVMLSGPLATDIDFKVGLFNGVGEYQNSVDSNDRKVVAGRLALETALPGLELGASGAWSGANSDENVRHDRLGVDGLFTRGPLTLRSEWMRGWDGEAQRLGYYALAAYRIGPDLQLAGRYDVWDQETRSETGSSDLRERNWVASLSYFLVGSNAKIQADLVRREFGSLLPAENLLQVNFQTSW